MSKYLIAGNWKMNTDLDEARDISNSLHSNKKFDSEVEMLVCPPFTHINYMSEILDLGRISLGAQNVHQKLKGAYTGEISINMLLSVGAEYVILGHSERRNYFKETNDVINLKVKSSLNSGLKVIVCIGETLNERESGKTNSVLKNQLDKCLQSIDIKIENLNIAYEPIWAIGTGKTATIEQITEAHSFLADYLVNKYNRNNIKLLYGGSMNPNNAKEILSIENVNGGLIGGASLDPDSFISIYNSAVELV